MSVIRPFVEARRLLGVAPEGDAADIKRAYRRATLAHPPDRDPDRFRAVRDAYELLSDPGFRAREILVRPLPAVDPPPPRVAAPTPRGATALALLRLVARGLRGAALLESVQHKARRRGARSK